MIRRPPSPRRALAAGLALLLLSASSSLRAGEAAADDRRQFARTLEMHDFEPRGSAPESPDRDGDGWPDFWEPVRGEGYAAYLAKEVRIVPDPLGERPGLWRDQTGHVLRVPFDGTRIAVQTRVPRMVDPELAYEVTAWARLDGLDLSQVRIWLVWLRMEEGRGEVELDRDLLVVPSGQTDWPETPLRFRRNDLPEEANALRLMLEIVDQPERVGADRFGAAWFDDLRVRARPKLRFPPVFADWEPAGGAPPGLRLRLQYQGLVENAPPEAGRGGGMGKEYARSLRITDLYGAEVLGADGAPAYRREARIDPGTSRTAEETIDLPLPRLGVYYASVTLFGRGGEVEAQVAQALGLWRPPVGNLAGGEGGAYGVLLDFPPARMLQKAPGVTASVLARTGVASAKVHLWPGNYRPQEESQPELSALNRELRLARASGVRLTGVLPATAPAFRPLGIREVLRERGPELLSHLPAAIQHLGPQIELWQWGADEDESFAAGVDVAPLKAAREALGGMVSASFQILPRPLAGQPETLPPAEFSQAVNFRVSPESGAAEMAAAVARIAPETLDRLRDPRTIAYPSAMLRALAPIRRVADEEGPASDSPRLRRETWMTLALRPAVRHERRASAERIQLDDLAAKAVTARALGAPRIFLGSLLGDDDALAAVEPGELVAPRPVLLAVRTLEQELAGAEYLGSFQLREPFRNYVFRTRDPAQNRAVLALWQEGQSEIERLDRLEIGSMPLEICDLFGNRRSIGDEEREIPIRRTPILLMGIDSRLALTRMSLAIEDVPALQARHALQAQSISIVNYLPAQLPCRLRLEYAAAEQGGELFAERNWSVRPEQVEINAPQAVLARRLFPQRAVALEVEPSPASDLGMAAALPLNDSGLVWPVPGQPQGEKTARIYADFSLAVPVRMILHRRFRLGSDLEVRLIQQRRLEADDRIHLQMQLRWFPQGKDAQQAELLLVPYYARRGQLPAKRPAVTLPAYSERTRNDPAVTVDFQIPRSSRPEAAWVGLEEEGGTRFFRIDVTRLLQAAVRAP